MELDTFACHGALATCRSEKVATENGIRIQTKNGNRIPIDCNHE